MSDEVHTPKTSRKRLEFIDMEAVEVNEPEDEEEDRVIHDYGAFKEHVRELDAMRKGQRLPEKGPVGSKKLPIAVPSDDDDDEEGPMGAVPLDDVDIDLYDDDDDDAPEVRGSGVSFELPKNPDLRWFFGQYGLDEFDQISLCRTHANHLAALRRARGPHKSGRPSGKEKRQKK